MKGVKGVIKALIVMVLAVITTASIGLRPAFSGVCDTCPLWAGQGVICCQDDTTQCSTDPESQCDPQATGYCNAFSLSIGPPGSCFWSTCRDDLECGRGGWCITHGQCYDLGGNPVGRSCALGISNPYCCFFGGGGQWAYVTCDDNHPCPECCGIGHCESGLCNFGGPGTCNEGEQCLTCTCVDNDGDGYGNPASPACAHPELDCDDTNPDVHPGAIEECGGPTCSDGLDNDCNGLADSKDPACKQWCPRQVQGSTVDSNRTVSRAPVALFAALVLPPCAILGWKGLRRKR